MPSVFAVAQKHKGGFRADKLTMTIDDIAVPGMLFQNVQFSFSQQVSFLYEIGGGTDLGGGRGQENVYYVGGRAQGSASIGRVIGPGLAQTKLIERYGDICSPGMIAFRASSGCQSGAGLNYRLMDAVLTTVAVSVGAQDIVINEQVQFMYADLQYDAQAA